MMNNTSEDTPNMTNIYPIPEPPTVSVHKLKSPRGAHLATRIWKPTSKPKCIILLVHGSGWHSGYYNAFAKRLNTNVGAFVMSYDQPGCGYSDREPGSPPNCTHIRSMDDLVEDVFAALAWTKLELAKLYQDTALPVFLLGESFGAPQVMKAAFYAAEQNIKLTGVISLAGLVRVGDSILPPAFVVNSICWLAKYYPKTIMRGVDTQSTFDDAFGDKKWARTARADPKIVLQVAPTLSSVATTLSAGDYILENAIHFPVPILAIHARLDVRTKAEAIQEFCDKVGHKAVAIIVDSTTCHMLLHDVPEVTNQTIRDICEWVERELKMK